MSLTGGFIEYQQREMSRQQDRDYMDRQLAVEEAILAQLQQINHNLQWLCSVKENELNNK